MIYEQPSAENPLSQGDILLQCPLVYWEMVDNSNYESVTSTETVVVLTQACDLANTKTSKVQVAVMHEIQMLVDEKILKPQTVRDQIRRHRVFGWYFLPAGNDVPESIVDLRDIHTVPRQLLEQQIASGHRVATLKTPYREHLAQHFAVTYSRIALPEPYATED